MNKAKRKAVIAGNWKMNKTATEAAAILSEMKPLVAGADCGVVICAPFTDLVSALEATKGAGGEALLNAMKGQVFESPRGQVLIDAQTRDIVHDMYIRKVEKKDGQLYNVEFDVIKDVKDPGKK